MMTNQTICLIFTAILSAAIILLFDVFNVFHQKPLKKKKGKQPPIQNKSKRTLNKTLSYYTGRKDFFMVREVSKAQRILEETRRNDEYKKTLTTCVVLGAAGAVVGMLMGNALAIPILAFGLFMAPLWKLKLYQSKYKKYISGQLESGVSLITTSYIRSGSIIEAFEENIPSMGDLIKPYFEEFVAEYKVNANMKMCIQNLQDKISDKIFEEWCDCLIKSYENSEMKENLLSITEKYSSVRIVQDELDAETSSSIIEYIVMLAVMVLVYPMVNMLNAEWFAYYATAAGKVCIAYTMIIGLYSIKKLLDVTTPVQFER